MFERHSGIQILQKYCILSLISSSLRYGASHTFGQLSISIPTSLNVNLHLHIKTPPISVSCYSKSSCALMREHTVFTIFHQYSIYMYCQKQFNIVFNCSAPSNETNFTFTLPASVSAKLAYLSIVQASSRINDML